MPRRTSKHHARKQTRMTIDTRFPILSFTSKLLRIIGFLAMLGAVFYGVYFAVIEPALPDHGFGPGNVMNLLFALGGLSAGLLVVVAGECIGVLFAIEANTRMIAANSQSTSQTTQTLQ